MSPRIPTATNNARMVFFCWGGKLLGELPVLNSLNAPTFCGGDSLQERVGLGHPPG